MPGAPGRDGVLGMALYSTGRGSLCAGGSKQSEEPVRIGIVASSCLKVRACLASEIRRGPFPFNLLEQSEQLMSTGSFEF